MKSIIRVVSVLCLLPVFPIHADGKRDKQLVEIEAIKAELKPLREEACLEADVIAAKKRLDTAYREYWETVRAAMTRLDPSKKKLIEREVALRKALNPVRTAKTAPEPERSGDGLAAGGPEGSAKLSQKPAASPTPAKKAEPEKKPEKSAD